jgi:hypothetical protein
MKRTVTQGALYRKVRDVVTSFESSKEGKGKNLFVEIDGWKNQDRQLSLDVELATRSKEKADEAYRQADERFDALNETSDDIKTEKEILTALQAKAVACFDCEAFVTAATKEYGDNLPRSVPLMVAKIATLNKLREGVDAKIGQVEKDIDNVREQHTKVEQLSQRHPHREIGCDLDAVRRQHRLRTMGYDTYATAASGSWRRTMAYDAPTHVVYVDNSPSFFETMLLMNLLSNNEQHVYHHYQTDVYDAPRPDNFAPNDVAPFAADLMGVDAGKAAEMGLPDSVFDLPPAFETQLNDIGVAPQDVSGFFGADAATGGSNMPDLFGDNGSAIDAPSSASPSGFDFDQAMSDVTSSVSSGSDSYNSDWGSSSSGDYGSADTSSTSWDSPSTPSDTGGFGGDFGGGDGGSFSCGD